MKQFQIILTIFFVQNLLSQEIKEYKSYLPKEYKIEFTKNYIKEDYVSLHKKRSNFFDENREDKNYGYKYGFILLYQKINNKEYFISSFGENYWLIEKSRGSKKFYFLGFQNCYCFLKPNKKNFIRNGIIELDAVFLRGDTFVSASEFDDYKIIKNGVKLNIKLSDLKNDTDKDGYNDIFETFYGLNKYSKDSDGDGINDLDDSNPLYKSIKGDYQYIYEDVLNNDFEEIEIYNYDTIKSSEESLCTINPKKKTLIINLKTNSGLIANTFLARYNNPLSEIKKIDDNTFQIWKYPSISEKIQYEYKKTNKGWEKTKITAFTI